MSWGISSKATEKEKIFADFSDSLNGMNCADGLAYRHYSKIWDLGRRLADKEYAQGKIDGTKEFAEWLCGKYSRMKQDSIGFEMFQNIYWKPIDEVLAEWQKEVENEP